MKTPVPILEPENLGELASIFARVPSVTRYDEDERPEAWVLAHALSDIQQSCIRLVDEHFPALQQQVVEASDVRESLAEIAQELRHVLYHVRDSRFLAYLIEDDSAGHCRGNRLPGQLPRR
jgi:hypothetical protein